MASYFLYNRKVMQKFFKYDLDNLEERANFTKANL